jgi:hypothetical protein
MYSPAAPWKPRLLEFVTIYISAGLVALVALTSRYELDGTAHEVTTRLVINSGVHRSKVEFLNQ